MKSKLTIFSMLWLAIIIFGCGGQQTDVEEQITAPMAVNVAPVTRGDFEIRKAFGGTVEGIEQSDLYAQIPEAIVGVNVGLGETVTENQVLIELDKKGPNSRYVQARAAYENAKKDYNRMKHLYEEKAISEQEFDRAATALEVAEADYNSAASLVKLQSPIDGVVTSVSVTLGQPAVPGKPLVTVARTDSVIIRFTVGGMDARNLEPGSPAQILLKERDTEITGVVSRISNSADPGTRGFEVEVLTDNKRGLLKPGTFVEVELTLGEFKDVMLVPSNAVFIREGQKYVYRNERGRAVLTQIEVERESQQYSYVVEGLEIGDTIITRGSNLIVDGDSLMVVNN
ncbi:MAG: efflux RND transporter periplasmic adaptor subunit [candidate division Zixibacteria bacterium]|nr:efflux RND transporter periplasmic adaptor subunit [candidate division Zixibacteria bacterium]